MTAPDPAAGTAGSTDATHAGELTLNLDYEAVGGVVTAWADTADEAVAEGLAGTITVTLGDESVDQVFGPDTVGVAADHLPFAVSMSGATVTVAFEDMADFPGVTPDFDYNDRSFVGVTVTPTADPVVDAGAWTWADQWTGETARVQMKVTRTAPDEYRWRYDLRNNDISLQNPQQRPLGSFGLQLGAGVAELVTGMASGQADWGATAGPVSQAGGGGDWAWWESPPNNSGSTVGVGGEAWFAFTTPAVPVVAGAGESGVAYHWRPPGPEEEVPAGFRLEIVARGEVKRPGAVVEADIDIDAFMPVESVTGKISYVPFGENTTEDSVEDWVIKRANRNNAFRKSATINQILDPASGNVWAGQVKVISIGNKLRMFGSLNDNDAMATGTILNNTDLPRTIFLQSAIASRNMRDAGVMVVPVREGNIAGASDSVPYSILWVDVSLKFAGSVSGANSAKDYYTTTIRSDGTASLGAGVFAAEPFGSRVVGIGYEAKGKVSPADWNYPGVWLSMTRDAKGAFFLDNTQIDNPDAIPVDYIGVMPGNDTTSDRGMLDNQPEYLFDLDTPGIVFRSRQIGTVYRLRFNFKSFAMLGYKGTSGRYRISDMVTGYIRVSAIQDGPGDSDWKLYAPPMVGAVAGDNVGGYGQTSLAVND